MPHGDYPFSNGCQRENLPSKKVVITRAPKTLILSSTTASSYVGATAASFCLQRLGIETVVLPTTLMGRHPGWGAAGGGAVKADLLRDVWTGVKAQDLHFDAVLTGYMGETDHIDLGAEIIAHVRSTNPSALIAIDPVMGDHGRLYICETRASKLIHELIPLADFITPNLWELGYINQHLDLIPNCLITSAPDEDKIGAIWQDQTHKYQVSHAKFETVPHGGGDSLAALFLGQRLRGETPDIALAKSVASVFEIMRGANRLKTGELPLIEMQGFINEPTPLDIRS